eukprot:g107.t1
MLYARIRTDACSCCIEKITAQPKATEQRISTILMNLMTRVHCSDVEIWVINIISRRLTRKKKHGDQYHSSYFMLREPGKGTNKSADEEPALLMREQGQEKYLQVCHKHPALLMREQEQEKILTA